MKATRLDGTTALVAGGAGEVGEGIVRAFLAGGARVVVPSRSAAKLDALRDRLGRPVMLKDVLAKEHEDRAVRINTLLATPILTRSRPQGRPGWLTADDAGAYAAYLASEAAGVRGETIIFERRSQLDDLES
jgi:uncharacterized protein YbjT (DUF2867 family)